MIRAIAAAVVAAPLLGCSLSTPGGLVETRAWHANGQLAEVRHFRNGREEGLQQAWTDEGTLYVNYEMRNGRRYGLMNSRPCNPVEEAR